MLLAVAVWGAAFAGFAVAATVCGSPWSCWPWPGAADTFTVVFRGTIVQQSTPDELRGRVTAADYVVGAERRPARQPGGRRAGLAHHPAISALSGGLVTIAGAVVIALALPAFTRYRAGRALARLPNQ